MGFSAVLLSPLLFNENNIYGNMKIHTSYIIIFSRYITICAYPLSRQCIMLSGNIEIKINAHRSRIRSFVNIQRNKVVKHDVYRHVAYNNILYHYIHAPYSMGPRLVLQRWRECIQARTYIYFFSSGSIKTISHNVQKIPAVQASYVKTRRVHGYVS